MGPILVWFRQDFRLQDNAALAAAVARGAPVIPVYVFDDAAERPWSVGGASRWWLHHSLAALDASLRARGSRLVLVSGESCAVLASLARCTGASAIVYNRRYEPSAVAQERTLGEAMAAVGVPVDCFAGALLFDPATVRNRQGGPFQVFTPFWRHCLTLQVSVPISLGRKNLAAPARWPDSLALENLKLLPRRPWDREFYAHWQPGEARAAAQLRTFVSDSMSAYAAQRDFPAVTGTSRLSPHLHFGEITPRQIWQAVRTAGQDSGVFPPSKGAAVFLNEIGWREFAYHLLTHFPETPERPLREAFARFEWAEDLKGERWRAWTRGQTGYPIVDAGMRQLWQTGWMHNRVRMIAASFLVKHLRLSWMKGATWFWDTLLDADLANNTLGWQWSAGCGADAAPYFRIFAPVTQGQKFDPKGDYVRRWVPELAKLPAKYIHVPWQAPATVLADAGVRLGENYPPPIVDHSTARAEALAAFQKLKHMGDA